MDTHIFNLHVWWRKWTKKSYYHHTGKKLLFANIDPLLLPILSINPLFCQLPKDFVGCYLIIMMSNTACNTCWQSLQYNSLKHPKALCSILLNKPDVLICFGGAPESRFKRLRHHSCNRWGACYFCESSSWHEMKQKTLTDRRPGGKVAVEARHSGRGLRALCCLKTHQSYSRASVLGGLRSCLVHPHGSETHTHTHTQKHLVAEGGPEITGGEGHHS